MPIFHSLNNIWYKTSNFCQFDKGKWFQINFYCFSQGGKVIIKILFKIILCDALSKTQVDILIFSVFLFYYTIQSDVVIQGLFKTLVFRAKLPSLTEVRLLIGF